jgi:hypothetical protein
VARWNLSMSAKAKRRRNAALAEARSPLDPEAQLAEIWSKWMLKEAEELRVQGAVEDGTATDEELRRHEEKSRKREKWRQVEEYLRDADIIIESHSYKTRRLIADKHLLRKRLAGWLMETVPLHHVDIDCHGDWNYDVFLYFPTDGELAASAEGGCAGRSSWVCVARSRARRRLRRM